MQHTQMQNTQMQQLQSQFVTFINWGRLVHSGRNNGSIIFSDENTNDIISSILLFKKVEKGNTEIQELIEESQKKNVQERSMYFSLIEDKKREIEKNIQKHIEDYERLKLKFPIAIDSCSVIAVEKVKIDNYTLLFTNKLEDYKHFIAKCNLILKKENIEEEVYLTEITMPSGLYFTVLEPFDQVLQTIAMIKIMTATNTAASNKTNLTQPQLSLTPDQINAINRSRV